MVTEWNRRGKADSVDESAFFRILRVQKLLSVHKSSRTRGNPPPNSNKPPSTSAAPSHNRIWQNWNFLCMIEED